MYINPGNKAGGSSFQSKLFAFGDQGILILEGEQRRRPFYLLGTSSAMRLMMITVILVRAPFRLRKKKTSLRDDSAACS